MKYYYKNEKFDQFALTFHVPKPKMGISRPLFNFTFGTTILVTRNYRHTIFRTTKNQRFFANDFNSGEHAACYVRLITNECAEKC